jgi:hypothetical protein
MYDALVGFGSYNLVGCILKKGFHLYSLFGPLAIFMTSNIEINPTHEHEKLYLLFGPLATFLTSKIDKMCLLFFDPYPFIYERRLFVCFACHVGISQTITPLATCLVPLKKPLLNKVHQVGFIMF